ncbi:MAG: hypothetical protein ABSB49_14440 [Polyangia bacterium]
MSPLRARMMKMSLVALPVLVLGMTAPAQGKKYAWEKDPGPISGKWKATCPYLGNFVVEFKLTGDKKASGYIDEIGDGGKFGYAPGDEIFRLAADDYGDWVGKLRWRSLYGGDRWDPIRLVATPDNLNATMTTSECYKNMPRVQ